MKKLILIFVLVITICVNFASAQQRNVMGKFNPGIDTYASVNAKVFLNSLKPTYIYGMPDTLIDVYVRNYAWGNKVGVLELFFGNDILYVIKFTSDGYKGDCVEYLWVDDNMWKHFKEYWE